MERRRKGNELNGKNFFFFQRMNFVGAGGEMV